MRFFCFFNALGGLALALPISAALAQPLLTQGDVSAWEYHTLDDLPETAYQTGFDADLGQPVLIAASERGASGYILRHPLDLAAQPCLQVNWRIEQAAQGFDEREKSGDDYALRLTFTARSGLRYRSLVIAHTQSAPGSSWKSPYSSLIHDVRVYSLAGPEAASGWQRREVNLADLWRAQFGDRAALELDAVGLMTDADDSQSRMAARYGDVGLGGCSGG